MRAGTFTQGEPDCCGRRQTSMRERSRADDPWTMNSLRGATSDPMSKSKMVSAACTSAIVMRRSQRKFTGIADLAAIPGVDRSVLVLLKDRLQF